MLGTPVFYLIFFLIIDLFFVLNNVLGYIDTRDTRKVNLNSTVGLNNVPYSKIHKDYSD